MIEHVLLDARCELHERADARLVETLAFARAQGIDLRLVGCHVGGVVVTSISLYPGARFDFSVVDDNEALVFEAFGADDETVMDLVAIPLANKASVTTMFGRCALLGLCAALNPATYFMGGSLAVHETALEWLRSACRGAAIVEAGQAARILRDLQGPIAAANILHGRRLKSLIDTIPTPSILVPERRVA